MSRSVSSTLKQAVFAAETDEVFIVLIEIDHASLAAPIRVCSNGVDVTSNGDTYVAFPFSLALPDDDENARPVAKLAIDNIDRSIVQAIRSISSAPSVTISIVLASDPDTVEATWPDFIMTNVKYNAHVVEGDISIENFTGEPYPAGVFSPGQFPGLF